jgi:hypothetical protein
MKKSELKEMIKARVKGLMEAGKEVVITTQDGTSKTASSAEKLRAKQASDNDDIVTYQKRGATNESINKKSINKKSMNKEFLKMQKLAGLITESQFQKKLEENETLFKNNKMLFNFLNADIEEFAKDQLEKNENLTQTVLDYMDYQDHDHNTKFSDLDANTQQQSIKYLVQKGLKYYGEWIPKDDDDDRMFGVGWNMEVGLVYNWTDEAPSDSDYWNKEEFKGRKFYSVGYNF